jgi:hypothetical protein
MILHETETLCEFFPSQPWAAACVPSIAFHRPTAGRKLLQRIVNARMTAAFLSKTTQR